METYFYDVVIAVCLLGTISGNYLILFLWPLLSGLRKDTVARDDLKLMKEKVEGKCKRHAVFIYCMLAQYSPG